MEKVAQLGGEENNFSNLEELYKFLEKANITTDEVVGSIAYDKNSQNVVIQMGRLFKKETDKVEENKKVFGIIEKIRSLSEPLRAQYKELFGFFEEWKPCRQELVETSTTYAEKLDRNFYFLSSFRIITSVVDIVGVFLKPLGSRFALAMDSVPAISLCSLFVENILASNMYSKVKVIAKKDQELFEHMKKWFQQTEELDRAVRNFFPYGIDEDLLRRIDRNSATSDTFSKLFMCIVACNAQRDEQLFQNVEFLEKATLFATSPAGTHWYNKVKLDPIWRECVNFQLTEEMKKLSTSPESPQTIGLEVANVLYQKKLMKVLLNIITICSAVGDLQTEKSETMRELARKSRRELTAMDRIMELLRPRGFDRDGDVST